MTNLRGVEYNWRQTRRHLTIQPDLDTGLNLVLGLDQSIKQLVRVDDSLTVVSHETN